MKAHKFFLFLVSAALAVVLFTGCPGSINPGSGDKETKQQTNNDNNQNNNNEQNNESGNNDRQDEEVKLIDYKFKVFELPHDSEGLTVVARIILNKKIYRQNVGTIKNYTPETCIEGTVQLPSKYDEFSLWLIDNNDGKDDAIYYLGIDKNIFYKESTGTYEIDGFYYIYDDSSSLVENYVGINEAHFKELELDKEYKFDYNREPLLLFYLDNMKDKSIAAIVEENKSVYLDENGDQKEKRNTYTYVYYSSDIKKIMSYDVSYSDMLYERGEEIQDDRIYFMVKPMYYNSFTDKDKTESKVKFTRIISDKEKCLTIDKSVFASDGMLYASGTYIDEKTLTKLYKINPDTNERIFVHEFEGDITALCEASQGTLLVSYSITDEEGQKSTSISKINLVTGNVSDSASGIEKMALYMIPYKNDKVVVFAKDFKSTESFVLLIDSKTGDYKLMSEKCLFSLNSIREGFYVPEQDIIIYTNSGSPKDFSFLKIDETDSSNPMFYGYDTKYHTEYEMHYPIKLLNTNPLEVMTADGDIFRIDTAFIDSVEPVDDFDNPAVGNYYHRIKDWCEWNRKVEIECVDFFIKDKYFYIIRLEEDAEHPTIYNTTFVEKYSFETPDKLIDSCQFEHEDGMKFWTNGEKLYLQATYWDYLTGVSKSQDMISFHEIDF
ncbi:MAG: hypothetical protein IKR64_08465 [Treponema sp.]|nr:hypothetical protein [Treponema sp.]